MEKNYEKQINMLCGEEEFDKAVAELDAERDKRVNKPMSEEEKKYREDESATGSAAALLKDVTSGKIEVIPTGWPALDRILGGGLYGKRVYTIGAGPGAGKTAFCVQMATQLAAEGYDVLYFSLEVTPEELAARCLSRETFVHVKDIRGATIDNAKCLDDIYNPNSVKNYVPIERELVNIAIKATEDYMNRIFMITGMEQMTAAGIRERTDKHIAKSGRKPVIIIDYLQLMPAEDPRTEVRARVGENIKKLHEIADQLYIPIVVISSVNRDSYTKDISMQSFKESGDIEFGSDIALGLQLNLPWGQPDESGKEYVCNVSDYNTAMNQNLRSMQVKIIKNRQGKTGDRVAYSYMPKFHTIKFKSGATTDINLGR